MRAHAQEFALSLALYSALTATIVSVSALSDQRAARAVKRVTCAMLFYNERRVTTSRTRPDMPGL